VHELVCDLIFLHDVIFRKTVQLSANVLRHVHCKVQSSLLYRLQDLLVRNVQSETENILFRTPDWRIKGRERKKAISAGESTE
jgi:hypothetical protein